MKPGVIFCFTSRRNISACGRAEGRLRNPPETRAPEELAREGVGFAAGSAGLLEPCLSTAPAWTKGDIIIRASTQKQAPEAN